MSPAAGVRSPERRPRIALTMGDPAGVGPELVLRACADARVQRIARVVPVASRALLKRVAAKLRLKLPAGIEEPEFGAFDAAQVKPGVLAAACGAAAGACIEHAIAGCLAGRYAGLVTAPINKAAIAAAGIPFPGHTEWLAERCGHRDDEAMLMYDRRIAVVLATAHVPLARVPALLHPQRLVQVGRLLAEALRRLRGRTPRLAMLGLNPHAGEGGLLGHEDRACTVAVGELLQLGIDCEGPLPADTAFTPANRKRFDGYIACYHDQGLIPFKALAFDQGVNVTLGLPLVRTSPDHGTAFDIAWTGTASPSSLIEAVRLAARLAG